MDYQIKRSAIQDLEWHVYAPNYCGVIMLIDGVYEGRPYTRQGMRAPCVPASFSEINLAAEYLVEASQ